MKRIPFQLSETVVENEIDTELMMFMEELEDCDLETKIEIEDDMLPLTKPKKLKT